ncbi:NAD(P)H-dependent oxidoreductase [Pseudomonas aeruginosa]|nr:NAD(P)H-dependent oxidoreductase [Pseudomonas aeruginosa]MCD2845364.1 NAD(P)H-dependent oxidoreductase [Pseudomonas aeruginosa]MCD2865391.1 NAD(P)H-dependent oxidoreductase [Pseudomonas aeruginosa]
MKNALIINAHQRWENFAEGKLNQSFASVAEDRLTMLGYNVQTTVIDEEYDVNSEIDKHQWADVVIVQTPLFWMSAPWLFKKYIDEVFTAGLGGKLLIRPNEVLSGIAHARVLKVADHTLRIVVQHPHMRTGCLA